jgi:PIN domain nuclease of toxin-antitoxin system
MLWALARPRELASEARSAITSPENEVLVSSVSLWEAAIKQALGKLQLPDNIVGSMSNAGFASLAITWEHALLAGSLPPHHSDPFDRMLVAQATVEGLTLVSRDPIFAQYGVPVLPA